MRQTLPLRSLAQRRAHLLFGAAIGSLAMSQATYAQSSVTIFGVVDAAVTRVNGAGNGSRTGLSNSGNSGSRLGFRGSENLGGGLGASFWLEGSLGVDEGQSAGLQFNRRSTVSLSGNWGEIRLGRDYAPTYWSVTRFDPFNRVGVATNQGLNNFGVATIQNSNSIGYLLPDRMGGIYGQMQYAFGEKLSTTRNNDQGNYLAARIGYASGPLDVAAAYGRYRQVVGASDVAPLATGRDLDVGNIAASWDFGFVKPSAFIGRERVANGTTINSQLITYLVGFTAPAANGQIRGTLARYDRQDSPNDFLKLGLGYGYSFSKRTEAYVNVAVLKNKGSSAASLSASGLASPGARAGGRSSGFDIGVRHNF